MQLCVIAMNLEQEKEFIKNIILHDTQVREDIMRNIILSKWEKFNYWGAKIFLGGSMLDVVDDMVTWVDKIFLDERKRTN